jgi:hypothetical protein
MNIMQHIGLFFILLNIFTLSYYAKCYFDGLKATEEQRSKHRLFSWIGFVGMCIFLIWSL